MHNSHKLEMHEIHDSHMTSSEVCDSHIHILEMLKKLTKFPDPLPHVRGRVWGRD